MGVMRIRGAVLGRRGRGLLLRMRGVGVEGGGGIIGRWEGWDLGTWVLVWMIGMIGFGRFVGIYCVLKYEMTVCIL